MAADCDERVQFFDHSFGRRIEYHVAVAALYGYDYHIKVRANAGMLERASDEGRTGVDGYLLDLKLKLLGHRRKLKEVCDRRP